MIRDGNPQILVGWQLVASERDVTSLVESAKLLDERDQLMFRAGASLVLEGLTQSERATVLAAVTPDFSLDDGLWTGDETNQLDYLRWEAPAVETGISIDGRAWGWFLPSYQESLWKLIPADPSETILDVEASFNGASMTSGLFKLIGIRRWDNLAAVSWTQMQEDPPSISVDYEIENWNAMFAAVAFSFFDAVPLCLGHDEVDDWSVSFDADPMFSDELVGQALAGIWCPCADHKNSPEALVLRDVAGHDWRWVGTTWTPDDATPDTP